MDPDLVIGFIFVVIIIISLARKGLEKLAEQAGQAGEGGGPFEASADQIEDFLRSLGKPAGGEQQAEPPAAPAQQPPRSQARRPRPSRPRKTTRQERPRRPRKRMAAAPESEQGPAPSKKPARQKGLASLRRAGFSLRDAVVWSEILGPPVSMRRHRHHVPPIREQ